MAAGPPAVRVQFRALGSLDLHRAGTGELRSLLVQPKRLMLFAYLVLANPPRLHRRDSLLALFWPESSDDQARRALRQALHFLRKAVGPDVVTTRGDEEVGADFSTVWCDVREFERALDAGRADEALKLYRGHLLEGFHTSGVAAELGHWLEDERSRLRDRAITAAWLLADRAERDGNPSLAVQLLRDVVRLDPGAEAALRKMMVLLESSGDRGAGLRAYDEFARHLETHAEIGPSPETQALARRLRSAREPVGAPVERTTVVPGASAMPPEPISTGAAVPSAPVVPRWSRRWLGVAVAAMGVGVAGVAVVSTRMTPSSRGSLAPAMVIAVGAIEDRTGTDSLGSARVLRDLLATDLARVPGVAVVSQTRMQELVTRQASGAETRATLTRAARSAGAAEVLEGELYRPSSSGLRLDLRRVDVSSGVIRRAYTAEGADVFALVERLSGQVAAELGQKAPAPALGDLTTTSLVARRFYEEGVRAYHQGDDRGAFRLFTSALAEDSTFAMAAYFAARFDPSLPYRYAAQAVRMSGRATERERLLIATQWAAMMNHPSLTVLAESLARRFPHEPESDFALGRALAYFGDFEGAIRSFRRAADRDSVSLADPTAVAASAQPPCTACDAFNGLLHSYAAIDSMPAAERVAREWVARQPRSLAAWNALARTLAFQGRFAEALAALRTRQARAVGEVLDDGLQRAWVAIRAGDFAEADRLLAERARAEGTMRGQALWWQVVSLRTQGRLTAALEAGARWRSIVGGMDDATARVIDAQVLFEMGRAHDAARLFESIARSYRSPMQAGAPDSGAAIMVRHLAWYLTHEATSRAAAGDTASLPRLADSLEVLGRRSAYGRDRGLHHHVRGLLALARGRREEAAASFQRAMYSPTFGYTRTNLELGRVLTTLGRPREAVAILAPALRGELEASNLYVTHAELHEALAQAYEAAAEPDSARAHYAWVAKAWRAADPSFQTRAARARAKSGS